MNWLNFAIGFAIIAFSISFAFVLVFALRKFGIIPTYEIPASVSSLIRRNKLLSIFSTIAATIALLVILAFVLSLFHITISLGNASLIFVVLFGGITLPMVTYSHYVNKKKSGKVLLEIRKHPKKMVIFQSVLGAFIMLTALLAYIHEPDNFYIGQSLLGLLITIFSLAQILTGLQIREHGFLVYDAFLPWNKIESPNWVYEGGKVFALKFKIKGNLPNSSRESVLIIPINKKHQVDYFLNLYLS
jgi:hypothetical protein